jgi:hypothetical protein
MRSTIWAAACLAAAGMGLGAPALAINKCTGKDGKIVYQDAACGNAVSKSEGVKDWGGNSPGSYSGRSRSSDAPAVEANIALDGPPEAAPLLSIYRRWIDAEKLAMKTARIALAGPAATMQAIQRESEAVKVAECMKEARAVLLDLSHKSTAALVQFMGKDELTGMVYQLIDRDKLIRSFEAEVARARCAQQPT